MKKHLTHIIIALLLTLSCKAQSPIVGIDASRNSTPIGAYYKDLNNEFNKFVGTWVYTNGNDSLIIKLEKREQVAVRSNYRDMLSGEYKYVENGIEIINTIPLPSEISFAGNKNIGGGYIITGQNYDCTGCLDNERRIKLYISDPQRDYLSVYLILRYIVNETNPEKMTATIISTHGGVIPNADSPTSLRVPYGEYLMIKQ
ncbi:DUF6705 family protein [Ichthyenterobacterium magnum]|uniref:DUF6705 domain-containing protein n=1 Tax=Ichthyenterobacterium magnum TaxID=1230530 RepID=A0A420DXS7_9FLAO|nr:DUF6705 family protein [Ichthyenterobacterium magnum]RKE99025.1 hypothetical protein BXY80_1125 [Ichthyenterobacterium magnum]